MKIKPRSLIHWRCLIIALLAFALSGCQDDKGDAQSVDAQGDTQAAPADVTDTTTEGDTRVGDMTVEDISDADATDVVDPNAISDDPNCDPLQPEVCAMPWPSSHFLAQDSDRVTGYTLRFGATTLPSNHRDAQIDPGSFERMDGYGVGTPLIVYFPELDGADLLGEDRIAESMEPDADILLFEVEGDQLTQIPYFAEMDTRVSNPERQVLYIRPAVLLKEGTRYVAALRNLQRREGGAIEPSPAFRALRSGESAGTPVADRQAHFDELFTALEGEGVVRADLQLAWDFWTASDEALHAPIIHMRDDALAKVGADGPELTIESVELLDDPNIAYEVVGTAEVPHYLVRDDIGTLEAYSLNLNAEGLPEQEGTRAAHFRVRIPHSALDGTPHSVVLHGHGLNGTSGQIRSGWFGELANQEHFIIVGVNMIGMSEEDVPVILGLVQDFSSFTRLSDRVHQGLIEHLLIARGVRERFDAIQEIADLGLVINRDEVWYNGISQGGIYGGTVMALSTDITRGTLDVPGLNYSTLLMRSVDFVPFFELLKLSYPRPMDQALLLGVIQVHWDTVDPVSYYRHLVEEPFANTPAHQVLLTPAKGDWQVSTLTNEVVARSDVGVPLMANYGRDVPLTQEQPYPHQGSGIVLYDFGNPWPAPGPLVPHDEIGDPHGKPRSVDAHNDQMMHFWRTGEIIDTCGGDGCVPE